jgi:pyruvate/2-oxoglutarate dehydrogenase complex dihydrolipoamide dehydrogenase (E3) component
VADHFQVLIIGGGQAGIPLAWALAKAGKTVALAEQKYLGGSCVNFGCTPTKAAIASARVAHLARRGRDFGLIIPSVEVDFGAVIDRAQGVALESRLSLDKNLENSENPKLIRAHARLAGRSGDSFRVLLGDREVIADQVVLDTGTRSHIPEIAGLDELRYMTSENWLEHSELPAQLAVIGGGYIGVEMAQFYRRMGSEVTVWHRGGQILEHEDEEISNAIRKFLEAEEIAFQLDVTVESVGQLGTEDVFIAVGRQPNTDDLGLDTVGVKLDAHGYVKIDKRLSSNVAGIWAAGDIRGGPQFTHTSWDDHRILLSQMLGDGSRTTDRIVPYAVFTDPELGRVGLTERELKAQGRKYEVKKFEMKRNGKARELGEPEGFIQVLLEPGSGNILGAACLCTDGAELVHMYVDMMNARASSHVIRDAVHIHPTLAEAIQSVVA